MSVLARSSLFGAAYKGFTITNDDAELDTIVTVTMVAKAGGNSTLFPPSSAEAVAETHVKSITQPLLGGIQSNTSSHNGASADPDGDWENGWGSATQLGEGTLGGTHYAAIAERTKSFVVAMPPSSDWSTGIGFTLVLSGSPQVVAAISVSNEIAVLVGSATLDTLV